MCQKLMTVRARNFLDSLETLKFFLRIRVFSSLENRTLLGLALLDIDGVVIVVYRLPMLQMLSF